MYILIAEDDFIISLILKKMVSEMGHEVAPICRSGKEAIREIFDKRPDCILMDYFLEDDTNGHDIMLKVQEQLQTPVIFITGQPLHIIRFKTKEIKHSTCISKPFSYHDLKKAIENVTR
jgi:DNA-binding response OmpR family regulator